MATALVTRCHHAARNSPPATLSARHQSERRTSQPRQARHGVTFLALNLIGLWIFSHPANESYSLNSFQGSTIVRPYACFLHPSLKGSEMGKVRRAWRACRYARVSLGNATESESPSQAIEYVVRHPLRAEVRTLGDLELSEFKSCDGVFRAAVPRVTLLDRPVQVPIHRKRRCHQTRVDHAPTTFEVSDRFVRPRNLFRSMASKHSTCG